MITYQPCADLLTFKEL